MKIHSEDFDVIIIGAGPAGLFAAYELAENSMFKILIVEKGFDIDKRICKMKEFKHCLRCKPCHIMSGMGGAGGLSDGTINLRPDIGGNLTELTHDENYAWQLIWEVDRILLKHKSPKKYSKEMSMRLRSWKENLHRQGLNLYQ
jgi:uncharacterized FAD-dependent dehydrogenase